MGGPAERDLMPARERLPDALLGREGALREGARLLYRVMHRACAVDNPVK